MRESLPEANRHEFDEALQVIALSCLGSLDLRTIGTDPELTKAQVQSQVRQRLSGKTVSQILGEAARVKAEREEQARREKAEREEQARQEALKELEQSLASLEQADAARARLATFKISSSHLHFEEIGFSKHPVLDLSVKNETASTISQATFELEVVTPGREVPWAKSSVSYAVPGGLQSGESGQWTLYPNDLYGIPEDRTDWVVLVACRRLDGSNGKPFAEERFSEAAAQRLLVLMDQLQYADGERIKVRLADRDGELAAWRAAETQRQVMEGRRLVGVELAALREKKAQAELRAAQLSKFEVTSARFYFAKTRFSSDPVIELAARNRTGVTISRVFMYGTVRAPDRELPLLVKEFNFSCEGGMPAGAEEHWSLNPNSFSEWGRLPSDREDLRLELRVKDLLGADGKSISEAPEFTEEDQKRMDALKALENKTGD